MINPNPFQIELPSKETYKLDSILTAVNALGHPQLGRKTILVAGTNGKGSTCLYLTELFRLAGFKVGTFTSPHVVSRTERIRIAGEPISEERLAEYEKKYAAHLQPLTYFERLTLLAFLFFKDENVDLQILEVGLGGRLDATNISSPDFSVITRIDFDHQEILGESLREIAEEKAGIMRPATPVFFSSQRSEALSTLMAKAESLGAIHLRSPENLDDFRSARLVERHRGEHQRENFALALRVFEEARKRWNLKSLSYAEKSGILGVPLWPGRVQIIREDPPFIIDGAHNPNAVATLVEFLQKRFPNTRFECVFGMMQDKPREEIVDILKPWVSRTYLPTFYVERQVPAMELKPLWKNAELVIDFSSTLEKLYKVSRPVLVVGSFYLAGEVLRILKAKGLCT